MVGNVVVFLCVNIVGALMHSLMETAQRRAFLDTRNCIAARLDMEDENEKLVRLLRFLKNILFYSSKCV
jgi:adenylate cyclase 1